MTRNYLTLIKLVIFGLGIFSFVTGSVLLIQVISITYIGLMNENKTIVILAFVCTTSKFKVRIIRRIVDMFRLFQKPENVSRNNIAQSVTRKRNPLSVINVSTYKLRSNSF